MIAFVRQHADRFGVEAICRTLGATAGGFITARGYRAAISRPRSARSISDEVLGAEIARLHQENYSVYGVRKMHAAMRRAGWTIGRDQTGRIMTSLGLAGARRGRRTFTTKTDAVLSRPADLVQRRFHPDAPRRLWVADITYVATWSGFAYVAFVVDAYFWRIVGWNVAATLKAEVLPLQALEMAAWNAGGDLTGLTHHSDHGSNYMSLVYTDRVVELGAVGSTGTVGDSYDNALAETVNGLFKTELIRRQGPWRTVEQVELATLEWVWWWNSSRLHSELGYRTPLEAETDYYAHAASPLEAIATQEHRREPNPGRFTELAAYYLSVSTQALYDLRPKGRGPRAFASGGSCGSAPRRSRRASLRWRAPTADATGPGAGREPARPAHPDRHVRADRGHRPGRLLPGDNPRARPGPTTAPGDRQRPDAPRSACPAQGATGRASWARQRGYWTLQRVRCPVRVVAGRPGAGGHPRGHQAELHPQAGEARREPGGAVAP